MTLLGSQELLLICLVIVLALFLAAFVLALLRGLWNRRRDDRLKSIEDRLKSIEDRIGSNGKR